jgi:hypothetical protein
MSLKAQSSKLKAQKGQVMLITVLALSGTILGATAIAGLLMLYQIRQTTDAANSAKAIYAADSGIEWRLYRFFKVDSQTCNPDCEGSGFADCLPPTMTNITNPPDPIKTSCETVGGAATTITIKSTGVSSRNSRAFEIILQ